MLVVGLKCLGFGGTYPTSPLQKRRHAPQLLDGFRDIRKHGARSKNTDSHHSADGCCSAELNMRLVVPILE